MVRPHHLRLASLAVLLLGGMLPAAVGNAGLGVRVDFTVHARPLPVAAVTQDSDGDGRIDRLVIGFSQPVDIVDPGGSGDGLPAFTLSGGRAIAARDYTASGATQLVLHLVPAGAADTGALVAPVYHAGTPCLVRSAAGFEMPDLATVAGSDGAAPVLTATTPASGAVVADTRLGWTASEATASGTVTWTRVAGAADPTPRSAVLTAGERAAGAFTAVLLADAPSLVEGAVYDIAMAVTDAAGNSTAITVASNVLYRTTPLPTLSIADAARAEGDAGTAPLPFIVTLSAPHTIDVALQYATADGSALAGSDYVATGPAVLIIPAGSTTGTIAVAVIGNTTVQPTRTFTITLSAPVGATLARAQAVGSILDDDARGSRLGQNGGGGGGGCGGGLSGVAVLLLVAFALAGLGGRGRRL